MPITHEEATREIPLPFIRWKNIGKRKRIDVIDCYWDVKPTGNFATDHNLAREYALNWMEHEHRALLLRPPVRIPLANIVADMVKQGVDIENDLIASGFLYTVNNLSMDLWTPAVIGHTRAPCQREHVFLVEHCAEEDRKRSERNRKNALAGAAKRRKSKKVARS